MESFGCQLPPGFKLPQESSDDSNDSEPPKKKEKVIGPVIPHYLVNKLKDTSPSPENDTDDQPTIGPALPPSMQGNESDEEAEVYGPMPSKTKLDYNIAGMIENRAAKMKDRLDKKDISLPETAQREEWMTTPDVSRRNQLGAISRCLAPAAKVPKKEMKMTNHEEEEKTTIELKKYNKSKRAESLVEMHQKKKKKKDKKEKKEKSEERKAFDRDEIAVRQFSAKQVNSVLDKAKYLNSRFASSKIEKYL